IDMADLEVADLAKAKRLVVIAATWGEGEPPARAARAYRALMSEGAPRLDGVEFAVLALGDTAYAEFCAVGKALDERRLRSRLCRSGSGLERSGGRDIGAKRCHQWNRNRGRFRQNRRGFEDRYCRGRDNRARQSQLVALREGDHSSGACLRWRSAGL